MLNLTKHLLLMDFKVFSCKEYILNFVVFPFKLRTLSDFSADDVPVSNLSLLFVIQVCFLNSYTQEKKMSRVKFTKKTI